jgi:membrane protein
MEFVTQRLEQLLWRRDRSSFDTPPRWLTVARYAYALARDLLAGELSLRAMSLVYTTMLAIVPLLAFSFAVLKALGIHRDLAPLIFNFLAPLGPRAGELTTQIIGFVDNVSGSTIASISIALLLLTALSMAQKVESSFNYVWRVDRPRSFARRFTEYLSVMFVGPLIMSVAIGFTASLASTTVMERLALMGPFGAWLASLGGLAPYALVIAAFSFLYVFVPNTRVYIRPAVYGGLFAGVLWAGCGSLFTSFFVSVSRWEAIYSGFAIVIIAMLWMHLSWLILLLGAQLAFYLQNPEYLRLGQRTESRSNRVREHLALSTMLLVGRDFEKPGHGWRVESLAARIRIPKQVLEPVVSALMHCKLLSQTSERRLIPARDPRRISVSEILDAVRSSERDHATHASTEWNATVLSLTESVEQAIRSAVGDKSLADVVDTDVQSEAAATEADAKTGSGTNFRREHRVLRGTGGN